MNSRPFEATEASGLPEASESADDAEIDAADEAQPDAVTDEAVESAEADDVDSAPEEDGAIASEETVQDDAEPTEETVEAETEPADDTATEEQAEEEDRIEISGVIERSDGGLVLVSDFGDYLMAGKGIAGMIGREVEVVGTVVETDDGLKINVISISPVK